MPAEKKKSDRSLKSKAIKIRGGREYVNVAERVIFFNDEYPNGSIRTELLTPPEAEYIVIRATVCPDVANPSQVFVGHSQATIGGIGVNKTAALENAETSAVGRALGMMGIGVIESIASVDEINKAQVAEVQTRVKTEFEKQIDAETDIAKLEAIKAKVETSNRLPSQKMRMKTMVDERIRAIKSGGTQAASFPASMAEKQEKNFEANDEGPDEPSDEY